MYRLISVIAIRAGADRVTDHTCLLSCYLLSCLASARCIGPLLLDHVAVSIGRNGRLLPIALISYLTVGLIVPSQRWRINGGQAHGRVGRCLDQFVR